jgi:hypothetical protein
MLYRGGTREAETAKAGADFTMKTQLFRVRTLGILLLLSSCSSNTNTANGNVDADTNEGGTGGSDVTNGGAAGSKDNVAGTTGQGGRAQATIDAAGTSLPTDAGTSDAGMPIDKKDAAVIPPANLSFPPDITDYQPTAMQKLARPGYLLPIKDPDTGNMLVRITDESTMTPRIDDGLKYLKHQYAKAEPWNADGSLIYLPTKYPGVLLDGHTFKVVKQMPSFVSGEQVWSHINPKLMFGVERSGTFKQIDVLTGTISVIASFPQYSEVTLGFYEGNLSNDDRYVVLTGQRGANLEIFTYDLLQKKIMGTLVLPGTTGNVDSDFCSVTPSGKFVVVFFTTTKFGYSNFSLQLYDMNMKWLRQIAADGNHVDFQYDTAGDEVIVVRDNDNGKGSNDRGIFSVRLSDGRRRREMKDRLVNWATHTSCRNIHRPGWCYISEHAVNTVTDYNWSSNYNEVFALKLDGSGTVERFAKEHHNTALNFNFDSQQGYTRSPMAVPNLDGSLVMFASDWEDASLNGVVHTYVAGRKLP